MINYQALEQKSILKKITLAPERGMRIFVPIDFSNASDNALEYAMKLAKACDGTIDLLHIINANELPNSENPLIMSRAISALKSKAQRKVNSLREIISENGVNVTSSRSLVGNRDLLLRDELQKTSPDLIVIDKAYFAKKSPTHLSSQESIPMLMVPATSQPTIPSKIVFLSDRKPIPEKKLSALFTLVRHTTKSLFVFNIDKKRKNGGLVKYDLPRRGNDFRFSTLTHEIIEGVDTIEKFLDSNRADLLSVVYRPRTFLDRIFGRPSSISQIGQCEIPTLLIPV